MTKKYGSFFRKLILAAILCVLFRPGSIRAGSLDERLDANSFSASDDTDYSEILLAEDSAPSATIAAPNLHEDTFSGPIDFSGFSDLSIHLELAAGGNDGTGNFTWNHWAIAGTGKVQFATFGTPPITAAVMNETNLPSNSAATGDTGEDHAMTVPEPSGKGLFALGSLTACIILYRRRAKSR